MRVLASGHSCHSSQPGQPQICSVTWGAWNLLARGKDVHACTPSPLGRRLFSLPALYILGSLLLRIHYEYTPLSPSADKKAQREVEAHEHSRCVKHEHHTSSLSASCTWLPCLRTWRDKGPLLDWVSEESSSLSSSQNLMNRRLPIDYFGPRERSTTVTAKKQVVQSTTRKGRSDPTRPWSYIWPDAWQQSPLFRGKAGPLSRCKWTRPQVSAQNWWDQRFSPMLITFASLNTFSFNYCTKMESLSTMSAPTFNIVSDILASSVDRDVSVRQRSGHLIM